MYAKIGTEDYAGAEEIFRKFQRNGCYDDNEILYIAAEKLYEKSGDEKKFKEIKKVNKDYEKKLEQMMEAMWMDEEDEEDLFIDGEDLPF